MFYTGTDATDTISNDKKYFTKTIMKQETYFIPVKLLKEWSDANYEKLNRSVDVDMITQHYPKCVGVMSYGYIDHEHAFGKEVEPHYRLMINTLVMEGEDDITLFLTQDITASQKDLLDDIKEELMDIF